MTADGGDLPTVTPSGLELASVYTGEDIKSAASSLPGQPPYTRGIYPAMYRDRLWVMGQYSGVSSPQETNRRIRELLRQGQAGFSIALDLPSQNGYDSDHPRARGEVGRVGVPMSSLDDMLQLLDGIDLASVRQIRTTGNAIGPIMTGMFLAASAEFGVAPDSFRVMLQNDILKEYIARGTFIFPPRPAVEFAVDVIEYCVRNLPGWEPIEFCGYHIRDSGADAIQELGLAMAHGHLYLDRALSRGFSIDDIAPHIYMFLSAHINILEEVAKFRAARRLWDASMTGRYGAELPASRALKIFCYTLGSLQIAQDPLTNIARVAYQTLAAVLGGVQTLATSSFDEALGLPSDTAARIALRTQQIAAYETGVAATADPLGGSYAVERLTDQVEAGVLGLLREVEQRGGILACHESGWLRSLLDDAASRQTRAIEDGEQVVVGLNRYVTEGIRSPTEPSASSSREETEERQLERLAEIRARRSPIDTADAMDNLDATARSGTNTVEPIHDALRAYVTIGEICQVLRGVWGEYVPSAHF